MYMVTVAGSALGTAFGFLRWEWPIMLANAARFCLAGFVLLMNMHT